MAGPGAWQRFRALLRRRDAPLFLHDASALDLADDAAFDAPPRLTITKLRAVAADDGADPAAEAPPGPADDDALLEPDVPLAPGRLSLRLPPDEPCARCRRRPRDPDSLRRRRVAARLALAALLYLLFMVGELVGECAAVAPNPERNAEAELPATADSLRFRARLPRAFHCPGKGRTARGRKRQAETTCFVLRLLKW